MRINAPQETFSITVHSPGGAYTIHYAAVDKWDGEIMFTTSGVDVWGAVLLIETEADGGRVFQGMTSGMMALYKDEFWFQLRPDRQPPTIEYWGNQVLWRRDEGV